MRQAFERMHILWRRCMPTERRGACKGMALPRASHCGKIALADNVTSASRLRQRLPFSRTLLS